MALCTPQHNINSTLMSHVMRSLLSSMTQRWEIVIYVDYESRFFCTLMFSEMHLKLKGLCA